MSLHVQSFGGGVARLGASDTRQTDEVLVADSYEIGPRGALVCASDTTDYVTLNDAATPPVALARLYGLLTTSTLGRVLTLSVGEGGIGGGVRAYLLHTFDRTQAASPQAVSMTLTQPAAGMTVGAACVPMAGGAIVTGATVQGPQKFADIYGTIPSTWSQNMFFVCVGAREGAAPRTAPGLYIVTGTPAIPPYATLTAYPVQKFDALGTGPRGEFVYLSVADPRPLGTKSQQLYFRGVIGFNGYAFGWGFDAADTANGDGPGRVMFSNLGRPTKWGNDNVLVAPATAPAGDRLFTDSDAIVLGTAGEIIRAALVTLGKLFFGTNRGLHFISGYGRDTFTTNGAVPVMYAFNVAGPGALIEGPDRLLYGVGDQGLWRYDGMSRPEPLFEKARDFAGHATGWWDLIWRDPTRGTGYPGSTNADLLWTAVDWSRQQVLVGIPWCDASSGTGFGTDTVVIKFHVRTGGFTRQVFGGVQLTAAGYFRAEGGSPDTRFLGTATRGATTVQTYGAPNDAQLPRALPVFESGPLVPFGPDGQGVVARAYVTLAWSDRTALPLAFRLTTTVDDTPVDDVGLTLGPNAPDTPALGDYWLDTAQTDTSLGNGVAGATVRATGGYLLRTATAAGWSLVAGQGGQGPRATLTLPLTRRVGTRVTLGLTCVAASGRFELEGLGLNPGAGVPDA